MLQLAHANPPPALPVVHATNYKLRNAIKCAGKARARTTTLRIEAPPCAQQVGF